MRTLIVTLLVLISITTSPVAAMELQTCSENRPTEIQPTTTELATLDLMQRFHNKWFPEMGLVHDLVIVPKPVQCTFTGAIVEIVLIHPGFPELKIAFPDLALGPTYMLWISRYALAQDPTVLEWILVHELCHIRQGTIPAAADKDEASQQEEWAERCVTEVLGEIAHAAAFTYVINSTTKDPNDKFNLALRLIQERVIQIPNPW